ncbi:MAG: hypothetical protein K0R65_155 [Crocinitomicaceae bacterium]|jgi:hypothetical protein|nr:hypothetical protein [Crocinitomicaceae bacterium]
MRTPLFVFLLFSGSLFSQTKLIAHKSHSGSDASYSADAYPDNFGEIAPRIKKIKLLKNNCIVEFLDWGQNDTVCDHPYFTGQYTLDEIKRFYPSSTEFIGFEGKFFNKVVAPPAEKKNSLYLLALILFLGGASIFVFKPAK